MHYPISYKSYLDIIHKILHCKKYMYGSKRYGWMSYYHQMSDVMMDIHLKYGGLNKHNIEIYNDEFIIIMNIIYPNWDKDTSTLLNRLYKHTWNDVKMPIECERMDLSPNGIAYDVKYIGSLDDIASAATIISLSE